MRMRLSKRFAVTLAMLGLAGVSTAQGALIEFTSLSATEFQPDAGQKTTIGYTLGASGTVTLDIFSGDGDVVRSMKSKSSLRSGAHSFEWDGRDDAGRTVPDEAYHPVLTCACGGAAPLVADTRRTTGGVVVEKIRPQLSSDGTISFELAQPSRALVRVGIKGGAMMRAIDSWSPRAAGRARVAWDGFDQSGVVNLLGQEGLAVLVTAFTLPDHTIITSGNKQITYARYRASRDWGVPVVDATPGKLERDGKRLSRQASSPAWSS